MRPRRVGRRWAVLGDAITQPTQAELRAHPLLRAAGILHSGTAGVADRHDKIIAEEALYTHADE
jgi:hypothetical protein